ncbi:LysR family transcriptional regulator [Bacillus paralicheniformis]|jgi:LysR family transcriptional regulator, repressor for citA|uniref:LysR family transcriptional regulator n=1 Tax=Bacillus TaxID=1386 RepID=UPI00034238F4|nr:MULTISPECIES: LysR family transcriptional regulator [Bacillus]ETB70695.1 LysR family transcriptional regulator [Bacillus sp. CPSM8]KJD54572.1 LysR family transcriptional regulator [Bacillus amyloliquefaciens]KUL08867.1 LysR family transcriptional regulator [Bacillus licheniformis LMG 7559]MBC8624056.1 LysR family transcriptional regulator [Robertmurraya crescens]AGN35487.1 transcriptional regulator CitR [Bacillus paralicheniformis ATCC 9945a]
MDFKWLHTFVTAAKYENFRKTAETLFISQPTVTVQIKLLEEELGCQLFTRKGRSIHLTKEGRAYLPFALRLLEDYESSMAELHKIRQGYSQTLNLAVSPLIADTILPFVLKKYTALHPNSEIKVKIAESAEIAPLISAGHADIGLSCLNVQSSNLNCYSMYSDPVILVAPHDGRVSEQVPPLDVEDLLEEYLLLTHNHPEYWDDLVRQLRIKFPFVRTMLVSQTHITKRFISEGLGISFLPLSTVRRELMEGRLIEVPCDFMKLPVAGGYAISLKDNEKVEHFLAFLAEFRF